jgi:hypothetical protein
MPWCSKLQGLQNATCSISGTIVRVQGFDPVGNGANIDIDVTGVRNPSGTSSGVFKAYSKNVSGVIVNLHEAIPSHTFELSNNGVGPLSISIATIEPSNQGSQSVFTLKFSCPRRVLKGGILELGLPAGAILGSPLSWSLEGAITMIDSINV